MRDKWIDYGGILNEKGNLLTDARVLQLKHKSDFIGKFNKCWKCEEYEKVTEEGYHHECKGWTESYSLQDYFDYRTGLSRFGFEQERRLLYGNTRTQAY